MKKTGIFYGSTTGTTESVAGRIADVLGISSADVHDVSKLTAELVSGYEVLLLGTSTWGDGELQDDWYDGVKVLKNADLSHKFHQRDVSLKTGVVAHCIPTFSTTLLA